MYRKAVLLGLSLLPLSFAQTSNDFESGWDQTAWPVYAPDCQQGGTVSLDSTVAHSGKNSIKVAGAGGYCGHVFVGTTQVPAGNVYVRTWFRASTALNSDHVSFIVYPDAAEGTGKHLRFGGMDSILMYNRESDDATLPDLSPQGIATSVGFPALTWQCLEHHIGTDGTIETWLNGNAIAGLEVGPGISNPNSNGWKTFTPQVSGVYFGWESYGGDANTFWYDDIVVASSRIGCSGTTGGSSPSSAPAPPPASTTATTLKTTTTAAPVKSSTTTIATTKTYTTTTTTLGTTTTQPLAPSGCTAAKYAQCGGTGYSGCTNCASGSTCKVSNAYYSQCL